MYKKNSQIKDSNFIAGICLGAMIFIVACLLASCTTLPCDKPCFKHEPKGKLFKDLERDHGTDLLECK